MESTLNYNSGYYLPLHLSFYLVEATVCASCTLLFQSMYFANLGVKHQCD